MTLSEFLTQAGPNRPDERLAQLLVAVAASCARISALVRRGALADALGTAGSENVQGEEQKKLDVIANDIPIDAHLRSGLLAGLASEELDHCVPAVPGAPFLLLFDPLD